MPETRINRIELGEKDEISPAAADLIGIIMRRVSVVADIDEAAFYREISLHVEYALDRGAREGYIEGYEACKNDLKQLSS